MANAYQKAGVNIEAGYEAVEKNKKTYKENDARWSHGTIRRLRRRF